MNREDFIRMAHESHLDVYGLGTNYAKFADALERFYNIAVSTERAKLQGEIETLYAMYELVSKQRDYLMEQQNAKTKTPRSPEGQIREDV
jgi:hypothetical protein